MDVIVDGGVLPEKLRLNRVVPRNHLKKKGEKRNSEQVNDERSSERTSCETAWKQRNLAEEFHRNVFQVRGIEIEKLFEEILPLKTIKALGRQEFGETGWNSGSVGRPRGPARNE